MGAEEEHFRNIKNAIDWYEKALAVLEEYQIDDQTLLQKFKKAYSAAQDVYLL